jgi:GAF domain
MARRRIIAATLLTCSAAFLLVIEATSWSRSARLGPLAATTLACSLRLDALNPADRESGLREGDNLLLPSMSPAARTAAVFHFTPTQAATAGAPIELVVERDGQTLTMPYLPRHQDTATVFAAQLAFKLLILGIAMLLLWRGTDSASMILAGWCLAVGIGLPDAWWGGLPLGARIAGGALTATLWTCAPFLLYLVVEAVAAGVSVRARSVCRAAMIVLALPAFFANCVDTTTQAVRGCSLLPPTPWVANAAFVAMQLVIVAFFVLSYMRTTGLAKQRVRWVFWAFILSRSGVLLNLVNRLWAHPAQLSGLEWATVLIFPIGCAYAILRHRIINVNFVLNRTLVYTILTTMVVGLFILIEYVLTKVAASRSVGIAIDVSAALLIGFSFNALHRHVEIAIERALFRAKHEAANALRRLADEASFMENADALLQRAAREVHQFSGAAGAAIYERSDGVYQLTAAAGSHSMPEVVDVDDLAFVRLRKTRGYLRLSEVVSALGNSGIAFAFAVRGQLTGALVCRRRSDGEAYAPDEISLLGSVAHDIGAELYAIRAREQGELLDKLLAGSLDIGEARALMKGAT